MFHPVKKFKTILLNKTEGYIQVSFSSGNTFSHSDILKTLEVLGFHIVTADTKEEQNKTVFNLSSATIKIPKPFAELKNSLKMGEEKYGITIEGYISYTSLDIKGHSISFHPGSVIIN